MEATLVTPRKCECEACKARCRLVQSVAQVLPAIWLPAEMLHVKVCIKLLCID